MNKRFIKLGLPNTIMVSKLSKSIEDYLKAIYLLKRKKNIVRVTDIASRLGISLPSVTEVIRKLAGKGLVTFERYGPIELTEKGGKIAKRVYGKHKLLAHFFMMLGVDEKTAMHDACLAEHTLSRKTIGRLKNFVKRKGEV